MTSTSQSNSPPTLTSKPPFTVTCISATKWILENLMSSNTPVTQWPWKVPMKSVSMSCKTKINNSSSKSLSDKKSTHSSTVMEKMSYHSFRPKNSLISICKSKTSGKASGGVDSSLMKASISETVSKPVLTNSTTFQSMQLFSKWDSSLSTESPGFFLWDSRKSTDSWYKSVLICNFYKDLLDKSSMH